MSEQWSSCLFLKVDACFPRGNQDGSLRRRGYDAVGPRAGPRRGVDADRVCGQALAAVLVDMNAIVEAKEALGQEEP